MEFIDDQDPKPTRQIYGVESLLEKIPGLIENQPDVYEQHRDLLLESLDLCEALDLEVEHQDIEDGEHFAYLLTDDEIDALKKNSKTSDLEHLDGISITREERPEYAAGSLADMTLTFAISKSGVMTTYVFRIYTGFQPETYLDKFIQVSSRNNLPSSPLGTMLANMIDAFNPQENSVGLNEIDTDEYIALTLLIKDIKNIL